jgi:conjugative transfer signal peptidase TraF
MRNDGVLLAVGAAGVLLAGAGLVAHPAPRLLWNATASAPLGLYAVAPDVELQNGDWSAVQPPPAVAAWLARAGYLPPRTPLLKQVAAVGGQLVCRVGVRILVDGRRMAVARARDRRGRPLPSWHGCRRLRADQVFLLNAPTDSLDGRYFGPTARTQLRGRARPLLVWGG